MANAIVNNLKSTLDKPIGMLVDGVELYSPSLFNEKIYYGEINEVKILNQGEEYDVITPPEIVITDSVGYGKSAKVHANMKGKLKEILVLSTGLGFDSKPNISLVGGNIKGSVDLETNLIKTQITSKFLPNPSGVGNTTINFISNHNFEDGDEVVYFPGIYPTVVGLETGASYYSSIVDLNTISLHETYEDSLNRINVINGLTTIVGVNTGIQSFITKNTKNIINEVYIKENEAELYNKIVKIPSFNNSISLEKNGINLEEDYIFAKNHNFNEKDLIVYNYTDPSVGVGTSIGIYPSGGLSTTRQYYVGVIDSDRFKIYDAGLGDFPDDTEYNNENNISFLTVGNGNHIFKYPPIKILVSYESGSKISTPPTLKPVVLGSFESIFIEDYGVGYGLSEVVNIHKNPDTFVKDVHYSDNLFESRAVLKPIVVNGEIVNVSILNTGSDYSEDIEIVIEGEGKYAKLLPNIVDGEIISVTIISSGAGYNQDTTRLTIKKRGKNAKFLSKINSWTINQYFKNKSRIDNAFYGNGFVIPSKNVKKTLQFINFYPSNSLRESLRDTKERGESPILGWSYDGNPIFGPYFKDSNGNLEIAKSSYKVKDDIGDLKLYGLRPNKEDGYFIEDYFYDPTGLEDDTSYLDEHNGMFITNREEFPNGTYAYFMTGEEIGDNIIPTYPYVIGNSFKNTPNFKNYNSSHNQNIDITETSFIKNTSPLYLTSSNSKYSPIQPVQEKYKQFFRVKNVLGSQIEDYIILNSGTGYKVGDKLEFKVEDEQDTPPSAYVSSILGKEITNINVGITSINNVLFKNLNNKIVGFTSLPHNLQNNQFVYLSNGTIGIGTSTISDSKLEGNYKISVVNKTVELFTTMGSVENPIIIQVNDILGFSPNDYVKIDNEISKIIEIYPSQSKFLLQRISGLSNHTSGISSVKLLPTKFEFINEDITEALSISNYQYFNPKFSVGLGTVGTAITNTNTNTNYFVPAKSIYIPNHSFKTNQKIKYSVFGGSNGLLVSNTETSSTYNLTNGQELYVTSFSKDLLGISTVAYGQTSLTFRESSYASNEVHSFENVEIKYENRVTSVNLSIFTDVPHNLIDGDKIKLKAEDDKKWEHYVIKFDLNQEYPIQKVSTSQFNISLTNEPKFIGYSTSLDPLEIVYTTSSKSAEGGINEVKNFYGSSFYKIPPILTSIDTENGEDANIIPYSSKIGRIDTVDRVKDGFDFPSDITLQPKLSTTTLCYLKNISTIDKIDILFGGYNYNTTPNLIVLNQNKTINNNIILTPSLRNGTIDDITILKNTNNLNEPLDIIPVNNSNGFDILDIEKVGTTNGLADVRVTIDINQFPLIYSDYNDPIVDFPFDVGDFVFVENCRLEDPNTISYNSVDNSFSFYKVTGIQTSNGIIDYQTEDKDFGTYDTATGYGCIVNKKDMPIFDMILKKNDYINGETVNCLDIDQNIKFTGQVIAEDGWDVERSLIRITKSFGKLEKGDILNGLSSNMKGEVSYLNSFTMSAKFGSSRNKVNVIDNISDLNNNFKRLQDSYYYQDFSYSIRGKTPYEIWKEPVRSIIHPSGFIEFSDLQIISTPINNLKIKSGKSSLEFRIQIENENSFFTRKNYTIGYEDLDDRIGINSSTIERIYMGSGTQQWPVAGYGSTFVDGIILLPYILNKSNNVINLKDVSLEFTGTYDTVDLGEYSITFNSSTPNVLGVNTSGLEVGDVLGYSTYNEYPNNTRIVSIGNSSITTLYPHKVLTGVTTESLSIQRILNQNTLVGLTSFKLLSDKEKPIFKLYCNEENVNIDLNSIEVEHIFETGQIVYYENIGGTPIGIATTTQVIGGISTDILPNKLYAIKKSETELQLTGLSTSVIPLDLTSSGIGTHIFKFDSPNSSTLISIDNIIQTPVHRRPINLQLSYSIGIGSTFIYVNSGISSISSLDILKVENEYLRVISVGIASTNAIEVERGFLNTSKVDHTGISTAYVYRGNYLIDEDIVYFTSPPFGPSGLPGLKISSRFAGRVFSRTFSSNRPNDKNIILDDISDNFTGSSEFVLKENEQNVVGLYTNTNSPTSVNINNNPFILINNIPQTTNVDFEINTVGQNKIEFLSGVPKSGKILNFNLSETFGYTPLVAAAATVSIGIGGTISNVYLTGIGSGYRAAPDITIISNTGTGAAITATVSPNNTISGLSIANAGTGYSTITEVVIDPPLPYYNLPLEYDSSSSGIGINAKVSLVVGQDSTIQNLTILDSGNNYKVGDVLNVVGLVTNVSAGSSFKKLKLEVTEVISDTFSGFYPGQFLQFIDISNKFNSKRKTFDVYTVVDGKKSRVVFRNKSKSNSIQIENNFFIFINDILQEPGKAYRYFAGRLEFKEPPKEGSKCNILYYQGSIYDTEFIDTKQTLKEGDLLKFENSELTRLDSEQTDRVIRRIIDSNSLDTFPYGEFGISEYVRPLTWTKQKNDRIISGSLISKGRDEQRAIISPTAKLIWNLNKGDKEFYVDNAYPLFIELDNNVGEITEEKRNVQIAAENDFTEAKLTANVSTSSSISSLNIVVSGNGYDSPSVLSISNPSVDYKDPIWRITNPVLSLSPNNFNSFTQGNYAVSVGNSSLVAISTNLINWNIEDISPLGTFDLLRVGYSTNNSYVSVGSSGKIITKQSPTSSWEICSLKSKTYEFPQVIIGISSYVNTFNDVIYNEYINSWIVVGDGGNICKNSTSTEFIEETCQNYDYKSVDYNSSVMVAVGHTGISISTDGSNWIDATNADKVNYSSIFWDSSKFIASSDNGIYTSMDNGSTWEKITGSPTDIKKINKYNNVYIGVSTTGEVFTSINLSDWYERNELSFKNSLNGTESIIDIPQNINEIGIFNNSFSEYPVFVGYSGTVFHTVPLLHKAKASCTITNGQVTSTTIEDGGFGYVSINGNVLTPDIIISQPTVKLEKILTIKAEGDFGKIVGLHTSNTGIGTTTPSIKFELLSDYAESGYESLNMLGITSSQLDVGDYFIVKNSNSYSTAGYAITGITTSLGGMSNYPISKVGTATSYLDGVYRVDYVQKPNNPQGIVTVTCHVVPINNGIEINNTGIVSYYGDYSWSKIYDYEDRNIRTPLDFYVNTNNGLIGISSSPTVLRMPPLLY